MSAATTSRRLSQGGRIDRSRPLQFQFNGRAYTGYEGDTLASALLAAGQSMVARSWKYHRPRGLLAAGVEEPNALVQLFEGERTVPNVKHIRAASGLGHSPAVPDPDRYDKRFAHADVLVVGAGLAGLAAARAAARAGARVILCDEQSEPGGWLLSSDDTVDGWPAPKWAEHTAAELRALPDVTVLPRTTAFGFHDQGFVTLVERRADHLPPGQRPAVRERLWKVRAQQVVLATGAHLPPTSAAMPSCRGSAPWSSPITTAPTTPRWRSRLPGRACRWWTPAPGPTVR